MNLVKICSIVGLFLGVVYAGLVALPKRLPGQPSSMFVPQMQVPQEPGVAPDTQPPLGTKLKTWAVLCFFMGPFGALAGCGVGLLLDGAVRTFRRKPSVPQSDGAGSDKSVTAPKEK